MSGPDPANFVMSEPLNPTPAPPEKPLLEPGTDPSAEILQDAPRKRFAGEVLFFAGEDLRPEWRALGYFVSVALTTYWLMWLGVSLFAEPVRGPAILWREMYQEFAMLVYPLLDVYRRQVPHGRGLRWSLCTSVRWRWG